MRYLIGIWLSLAIHLTYGNNVKIDTIQVQQFGVLPNQDGMQNTIALQQISKHIHQNQVVYFPAGKYMFSFKHLPDTTITWLLHHQQLTIMGDGNSTELHLDEENPLHAYSLFMCISDSELSTINIHHIHFSGPQNPGLNFEKNKKTQALYFAQGNMQIQIEHVRISGNFYNGILASGGHSGYTRKLTVLHSNLQAYAGFSVGMFGASTPNIFTCAFNKFHHTGLSSAETSDKQAQGVHIYLHPDIQTHIHHCEFYQNYRNSIQFASGTKIYKHQYGNNTIFNPKNQIIEYNYFDSTAHDAIQLGFFFPQPIIRFNTFYNNMTGVELVQGAIIEHNFFGKTVAIAIEHTNDALVNLEKESSTKITNNIFESNKALYVFNNLVHAFCKEFISERNLYKCYGQTFALGSEYCGDSSMILLHSIADTFLVSRHGGITGLHTFHAHFINPIISGERFVYVGYNNNNRQDTIHHPPNSLITIHHALSNSRNNFLLHHLIFNGVKYTSIPISIFETPISNVDIIENNNSSSDIFWYAPYNTCKDEFVSDRHMIQLPLFSFQTFTINQHESIQRIDCLPTNHYTSMHWENTFAGNIRIWCANDCLFEKGKTGNIAETIVIKAKQYCTATWNRQTKQWTIHPQYTK